MKNRLMTIVFLIMAITVSGQVTTIPAVKEVQNLDLATIQRNMQQGVQAQSTAVAQKLNEFQTANLKAATEVRATMDSKLKQYISNTLNNRVIDRSKITIDPNKPYVSEVYYPNPNGVLPRGSVILLGFNLISKSGPTEVTVKLGQNTLICTAVIASSTNEHLWVTLPDFSGINALTTAVLNVKANGVTSDPVNIKLQPELETRTLVLTPIIGKLLSDMKSTSPMIYATDISQLSQKHGVIVFYTTTIGIYHFCPASTSRSTEYRGTDELFLTTMLKNNWKVKSVVYNDNRSVCGNVPENQTTTYFNTGNPAPGSLYLKVGWYNNIDLCFISSCFLTYIVEGPKGTSYL